MLTQEMLQELAEEHDGPCATIYSSTHNSGPEAAGDPIRLKTGIQRADKMLEDLDVDPERIKRILEPARDFQARMGPHDFGAGTLALFLADGFEKILHTPVQSEDGVFVSDRFHVKPLVPVLTDNAHFYVLALSQHHVRLLECTRYTQVEEPLSEGDVPQHILEVMRDIEPKKSLQLHTARPHIQQAGAHEAVYHGSGNENALRRHQLQHFFRDVNDGIAKYLDGTSPLVFAGVDKLFPLYQDVNTYPHLLKDHISGNPEHLRPEELREKAWELLEPYFQQRLEDIRGNFEASKAHNMATDDMKALCLAARDGRVGILVGAIDQHYWGRVPDQGEDVQMRAEPELWDYDLIDYAAANVILHGGKAYMVPSEQVPGDTHRAAAILRY